MTDTQKDMSIECSLDNDFCHLYSTTDTKLLKIEGISKENLNVFGNKNNCTIDDNANASDINENSFNTVELMKPILKLKGYNDIYVMIKKMYSKEIADDIMMSLFNGDMYLHDSCYIHIPYCWASSVSHLVMNGITYNNQLNSKPPKKRRSFIDMVKEFIIQLSHEIAGASAIADVFVYYSYFVQNEIDDYKQKNGLDHSINYVQLLSTTLRKEIEDDFQSLVHTLNMKLRTSAQSPFTNISIFDMSNLEYLFGHTVFPNGKKIDLDLVMEIQKIFCDWFTKGDPTSGLPYRFPVCTLNIRIDDQRKIVDQKSFDYFCKINLNNSPFNIYVSSGHKIASCCRLLSSYSADSLGNGGVSIGSMRVCTINLARFGHLIHEKNENIKDKLTELLNKCKIILLCHRKLVQERIDAGLLQFFTSGIMSLSRLFCTIGINGIYECSQEIAGDALSEQGKSVSKEILQVIHQYTISATEETRKEVKFNCEEVPAESAATKFADKDRYLFNMKHEIYSNQFVPLAKDIDVSERIKIEGEFSRYLSGGGITHINLIEKLTTQNQMATLINYSIQCGLEHFAVNYNFCKCSNNHVTTNKPKMPCKVCGSPVQEYTRIIGYFVPVSQFSDGRKKEHATRYFS